jgi:hypothetical protein
MNISRYLARTLVNANLMSTRDYAQRYWWPDKPLDDAENRILPELGSVAPNTPHHFLGVSSSSG